MARPKTEIDPDRLPRFLDDAESVAAQVVVRVGPARERVRRQLGDAGFALSDAEIDAIIAAASPTPA